MTKKDYVLLASVLLHTKPDGNEEQYKQWLMIVNLMIERLSDANLKFDEAKFRKACGLTD